MQALPQSRRLRQYALLALAAALMAVGSAAASERQSPNVVVILADDLGYGDISPYGGSIDTPDLARLADEGLRFTDFHSSGNVCSPTRAGLLTGRYQQRAGIPGVVLADEKRSTHFSGLQPEEVTLPEVLQQAGYATGLVGKWHLGYYPAYNPLRNGLDEFRGFVSGNVDYHTHLDNQWREDWWRGGRLEPDPGYTTHLITQYAVDFVEQNHRKPFFLLVAHAAVHDPYQGPSDTPIRTRRGNRGKASPRPIEAIYRDMVVELDHGVGRIVEMLRQTGLDSNTLVFFFSDNGPTRHGSAGPLRGRKGTDWEGGHRVPAIAWWPGKIAPGECHDLATCLDLMPTVLELAGASAPAGLAFDGTSLTPTLLQQQSLGPRRLFWDNAMRDGQWKLMVSGKRSQLFDLANDLGETNDKAQQQPNRVQSMRAAWEDWQSRVTEDATPQPTSRRELENWFTQGKRAAEP